MDALWYDVETIKESELYARRLEHKKRGERMRNFSYR